MSVHLELEWSLSTWIADTSSQAVETSGELKTEEEDEDSDDGDIEAQIQRELAGLQPSKDKKRPFQGMQLEMPCGAFTISALLADCSRLVPRGPC
jgi:hypothetical protein